jgi:hypothetical protein
VEAYVVLSASRTAKGFAIYLLGFVAAFTLENGVELAEHLPERWQVQFRGVANLYQRWSAGPRGVEPRYTALIAISEVAFPAFTGPCQQRQLAAALLKKFAARQPSIIVVDLAFRHGSCPPDSSKLQDITGELLRTIEHITLHNPVILAQSSEDLTSMADSRRRDLLEKGAHPDGLLLRPIIAVRSGLNLQVGLARLNRDFRRVPLEWPSYSFGDGGEIKYLGMQPTLSLAAVRIARRGFPSQSESVDDFVDRIVAPYTNLIPENLFIKVDAADLLCDTDFSKRHCNSQSEHLLDDKIRGKIAILGWTDDRNDAYDTAVGRMPGVALHANYIESLLAGCGKSPLRPQNATY